MIRTPERIRAHARAAVALCLTTAIVAISPAEAQVKPLKIPERPSFRASVDTNDWTEYYKRGMSLIVTRPRLAADAFYWAERLDPTRAEPVYARWAAMWLDQPQLLKDYGEGSERVLQSPAVQRLDSLNYLARLRNPMVYQGLMRLVLTAMHDYSDGRGNWDWNRDPEMVAWLDYTDGRFPQAVSRYGAILRKDPERHYHLRYHRALAFSGLQQFDSAATELTLLVEEMHRRDQKRLVYFYDSKAMFEYAAGLMYVAARRYEEAREAFMRALSDDLAFYPAHSALGTILLQLGDTTVAIGEYQQALDLNRADPYTRYNFSLVLMNARQTDAAIEHLRFVIDAEPYFAAPYYYLGRILDSQGKHAEAMTYYDAFVARAPRSLAQPLAFVKERITEFTAAGVVPVPPRVAGQ